MRVVFLGMGYSARAAAKVLRERMNGAVEIAGTRRSLEAARALDGDGFSGHVFDGGAPGPDLVAALARATHVVSSVPPGADGDPALTQLGPVLATAPLEWLGYYSTIAVYGDHGGAWVDETTPGEARSERAERRLLAEAGWTALAARRGVPLAVLRLAGIYGPGRSAFDRLRTGTAQRLIKPGQVFNRIHLADIARITALAAERQLAGVFNLADDLPAPPQDPVAFAAELAGVPPPPAIPFAQADVTPMQRAFYADNKRVSNRAVKAALGIDLLYPDYRSGLTAIHQEVIR